MATFERLAVLLITASLLAGAMVRLPETTDFVKQVGSSVIGLARVFSGTDPKAKVA